MMPVLHYTVTRNEIRPYMPAVPVVVSAAGYCFKGEKGYYLRPPPLPEHVVTRGADCGGFVATTRWGGRYRFQPRYYANWLMKWRPQWVAVIDLCCLDLDERGMPCYPGKEEVKRRQKFCTAMAHHFWAVFQHLPLTWVVTIQGWHPEEYVRHAQILYPLIKEMCETYCCDVGSSDEDGEESFYRVGIGSLCGRDPLLVREVIGVLPLHLWGSKLALLRTPLDLDEVVSMDTAAWNGLWGPEHEARRNSALSDVNR